MWFSPAELRSLELRAGDVAIVEGGAGFGRSTYLEEDLTGWGFQNSIVRVRPDAHLSDGRFINYALQSALVHGEIAVACNLATLPHFTAEKVAAFSIPAPQVETQSAVADYLDRETAEIDAFIADQEKLIELLTERRAAAWQKLIDEAVPPLLPLRRVIKSIVDGPFGSSLSSKHYSDSGTRVIRLGNVGINEFKREDEAYIPSDYGAELSAHQAVTGDVIVAGLGDDRMPLGRAAVVPEIGPAIVKADCFRVRPNELTTGPYLAWALSSPGVGSRMRTASRGSTRQRLNTTVVREILVPVPDLEMQSLLLARSRATTAQLDATIAEARQAIALSKERRAALISAAVTGKIDVREHGRVNA
ncbi:hypothetical protein [Pseudoclavibacter helvolus]|uniref:hypothetical protein n=1 Tax=Pseudoclavibacter helvolus TaxID=255205 RepID=UPI0024AE57B8|nr:hypothetical protein [Pseudoclavibacter helvolus]